MVEVRKYNNLLLVFDYEFLDDLLQDHKFTGMDDGMLSGLDILRQEDMDGSIPFEAPLGGCPWSFSSVLSAVFRSVS